MKKFLVVMAMLLSTTLLVAGEGHNHGKSCPMTDKKIAESKDVELTGKLLCKHCNLHQTEKCEKVFQSAANEKELIEICPTTKVDLEAISEEGTATVRIKGKLVKADDGTQMLKINEAAKV